LFKDNLIKQLIMTDAQIEKELVQHVTSFGQFSLKNKLSIEEGIYSFLTDFGIFLRDAISNNDEITIEQSFNLINQWFTYDNTDLDDKISVGILEVLTDTEKAQSVCFNNLDQRGLSIFNKLFERFQKLPPQ
jgi:hypothetical protein